jgi:exosortase
MKRDQQQDEIALLKDSGPWHQNPVWLFLLFNAVFVTAFFGSLRDLIQLSLQHDYDSYTPIIPLIVAYLIFIDRKQIFSQKGTAIFGLPIMVIGILLLFAARHIGLLLENRDVLAFEIFSLVVLWIGGFLLCFGLKSFRAAVFPLAFLFLTIPIPGAALDRIILFLQAGSANVAYGLLKFFGVPVARDGFVFHLVTIDIEVAKECSGIRSSLSLFITGILAAYFLLRKGWTRVVLMISLLPLVILKNGIRIFTLSTLSVYVDKHILDSDLHKKGGYLFFILALLIAGGIIVVLRRIEGRNVSKKQIEK